MAINPLSFPMPQQGGFTGNIDFSPLANLGNVYQQGVQQRQQQDVLSRLGTDPDANAQLLIKSGVPSLAEMGVRLQSQRATQAEAQREFGITSGLAREKFEADSPTARAQNVQAGIDAGRLPKDYMQRPEVQDYIASGQNIQPDRTTGQLIYGTNDAGDTVAMTRNLRGELNQVQPPEGVKLLSPGEIAEQKRGMTADMRAQFDKANDAVESNLNSISQMKEMKDLADKSLHLPFGLTGPATEVGQYLPSEFGGAASQATQQYRNAALQRMISNARTVFGQRPSQKADAWLLEAQGSINAPVSVQKEIMDRGIKIAEENATYYHNKAKEISAGTYYKHPAADTMPEPTAVPTQAATATPAPTQAAAPAPAPAPPSVKPSLQDFMTKARAANPGVPDSELAQFWKKKYGG